MDKCISLAKSLMKQGLIQNLSLDWDSENNIKAYFQISSKLDDDMKRYKFYIRISNYRLLSHTEPLTKEEEQEYVKYLGADFVSRDVVSRACIWHLHKWSVVDYDEFFSLVHFILDPKTNIKLPRSMRNVIDNKF